MSIKNIKKRLNMRHLNSKGDTIVEVMIVLVVLSMSLGIAYSTADASIINIRESEAHSNVNNLISEQVENLYANASQYSENNIYGTMASVPFCFNSGMMTDTLSNCSFTYNGTDYSVTISNCNYKATNTTIYSNCTNVISTSAAPAFVIIASWPPIGSGLTDSDTIVYQIPERTN